MPNLWVCRYGLESTFLASGELTCDFSSIPPLYIESTGSSLKFLKSYRFVFSSAVVVGALTLKTALLAPPALGAFLGGDPAAGSPTATLLRLFPPHETQIRRSQGRPRLTQESLGWNDGRCVQGAGTYSPRASDTRLLGIPCSRGWVSTLDPNYGRLSGLPSPFEVGTNCTCHCSSRVAREIRGILTCRGPLLPPLYQRRSPQCA